MGIFSYTPLKEGKGVPEDGPKLRSPFMFFYLFGIKASSIIKLNILYILCCLPIVTIGAATAGLTSVLKCYINDEHAFLIYDFFKGFKENFFKATGIFIINAIGIYSFATVYVNSAANPHLQQFFFPTLFMNVILIIMSFYAYPMMVTYELSFWAIIKNSFIFTLMKLPQNILAAALFIGGYFLMYMYPVIGVILGIIIVPSFLWMFTIYYNRNYIKNSMSVEE